MKKIQTILIIAALCGAALAGFTACQNPLDLEKPASAKPAEQGYGKVTISLGAIESVVDTGAARTVYPVKSGLTCVYTFTKAGGQPQTLTPTDGIFSLEYGEWTVEVKAYTGTAIEANLTGSGGKTFTVNAASQTVAVELAGASAATGTGTFRYRIQYPQGARISGFTMKKLPELTTSVTLNYGAGTTSDGVTTIAETKADVSAGFYFITLRLEQQGRYAGRSEVVHIYDKLTSEWGTASAPLAFTANDFTAVPLSEGVWADGELTSNGQQWFSFTATAATQYIHVNFNGTLSGGSSTTSGGVYVQVYDRDNYVVGSQTRLYNGALFLSQMLTSGQMYTIKVTPHSYTTSSGTYQIMFSASSAIPLVFNTWANGNLSSTGQQWFSFTATASTQYIHTRNLSTELGNGVNVQLYDSAGATVGSEVYMRTGTFSQTLTSGQEYTIKITPYNSSGTGTYQIAFNASMIPPGTTVTMLTADTWANGDLAIGGQNWYRFTATAATQYIHVRFGTLSSNSGVYVQLYDSAEAAVGSSTLLYGYSGTYLSRTLTIGQEYTIKITPNIYGTYQIAFTTSMIPPCTPLTANTWTDGDLSNTNNLENWYSFTATESAQYIYLRNFSTTDFASYGVDVQLYDSAGATVGSRINLFTSTSWTLTIGQTYYVLVTIHVRTSTSTFATGTYQIAFGNMISPGTTVTALTADTWANGSLASSGQNWYSFTATAATQYIHVNFGTLTALYVQVYNSVSAGAVGSRTTLSGSTTSTSSTSRTLTSGQTYYILITPYSSSYSGTYNIAFNASVVPPGAAVSLTADTWANGSLASGGQNWYSFTATAATQYIHVNFGTLTDLYVQVYDDASAPLGGRINLYGSTTSTLRTLTSGQTYYILVTPYSSSYSGTYNIAFNASFIPPGVTPTALTAAAWAGNIEPPGGGSGSVRDWYSFTATAATQYIHVRNFSTTDFANSGVAVQLYDSAGAVVGSQTQLSGSTLSLSRTLTSGQTYYMRVQYNAANAGTYQIAFNDSSTAP
jgi:hypothetical protein